MYDPNGNMTCRVENGVIYKQNYNAENRISSIAKVEGNCETFTVLESWSYQYDGDGIRVGEAHFVGLDINPDWTKSYYFGGTYETRSDGTTLKYCSIAGQTVAMRTWDVALETWNLSYFLADHLGSVVTVLDASGGVLSEQRYLPFGEVRTDVGLISQTDFGYTFQRNLPDTGLMDYRARFYSPYLNHFTQPDSIIPDPANPQDWNRYNYVRNNPIRYADPSGHSVDCGIGDPYCQAGEYTSAGLMALYEDNWSTRPEAYDDKGLSEDLENYLENHPDYDPGKDYWSRNRDSTFTTFTFIRQKYWKDRLIESWVCAKLSVCGEAANLVRYYDLNERFTTIIWSPSQNTSGYVLSDLAGITLALIGKGPLEISKRGEKILGWLSIGNSTVALGAAKYENDTLGAWLVFLSSIYPPTSSFVSAVSLGRDLGNGFQEIEYFPAIPR